MSHLTVRKAVELADKERRAEKAVEVVKAKWAKAKEWRREFAGMLGECRK